MSRSFKLLLAVSGASLALTAGAHADTFYATSVSRQVGSPNPARATPT